MCQQLMFEQKFGKNKIYPIIFNVLLSIYWLHKRALESNTSVRPDAVITGEEVVWVEPYLYLQQVNVILSPEIHFPVWAGYIT